MFVPRRVRFRSSLVLVGAAVVALTLLTAEPGATAPTKKRPTNLTGTVSADGDRVKGATVRLMKAGGEQGEATQLQATTTTARGDFVFDVSSSVPADATLYVTATGGRVRGHDLNGDVELAA